MGTCQEKKKFYLFFSNGLFTYFRIWFLHSHTAEQRSQSLWTFNGSNSFFFFLILIFLSFYANSTSFFFVMFSKSLPNCHIQKKIPRPTRARTKKKIHFTYHFKKKLFLNPQMKKLQQSRKFQFECKFFFSVSTERRLWENTSLCLHGSHLNEVDVVLHLTWLAKLKRAAKKKVQDLASWLNTILTVSDLRWSSKIQKKVYSSCSRWDYMYHHHLVYHEMCASFTACRSCGVGIKQKRC